MTPEQLNAYLLGDYVFMLLFAEAIWAMAGAFALAYFYVAMRMKWYDYREKHPKPEKVDLTHGSYIRRLLNLRAEQTAVAYTEEISLVPAARQPMSVEMAARWGAFLYEGLSTDARGNNRMSDVRLAFNGLLGQVEIVEVITDNVQVLWDKVRDRWDRPHPGVFEYEVISSLGNMYQEHILLHKAWPSTEIVNQTMNDLVDRFFMEDD
jgi:hypothetical protein